MMCKRLVIFLISLISLPIFAQHTGSFEFGKQMFQQGYHQEAKLVFERIIAAGPTSAEAEEAYYLLAQIHTGNNNFNDAENYYRTLYETFPVGKFREQALFNWALNQHRQDRYTEALETFNRFVQTFPASLKRVEALYLLLDCHYNLANYSRVIAIGRELVEEHAQSTFVPDLLLLTAKSYIKLQNYNDGENSLDLIIQRYPNSNARWESVLIKADVLKERADVKRAVEQLLKHLNTQDIPRNYEEEIRRRLADYYFESSQEVQALSQLEELIMKFDRSDRLAEYLYQAATLKLKKGEVSTVVEYYEKFERETQGLNYHVDFLIRVSESYFKQSNIDKSELVIGKVEGLIESGITPAIIDNKFAVTYRQARIKEQKGLFFDAIADYRLLLSDIPLSSQLRYEILVLMGDVFFEKLGMYSTAINYYNQVIIGLSPTQKQIAHSFFKLALCYEAQSEYEKALSVIQQINVEYLEDRQEIDKLNNMAELLRQYKSVDYRNATSRLLFSLINFLNNDDREELKSELINVALYDLKDVDSVLNVLTDDDSPRAVYLKGKAYLQIINRNLLQGKHTKAEIDILDKHIDMLKGFAETDGKYKARLDELQIEKDYVASSRVLTAPILDKIERYIETYPQDDVSNRFRFLAGYNYLSQRIFVRADEYLKNVKLTSHIPVKDYQRAFSEMASYFYEGQQYESAVRYYERIDQSVTRPETMYRYAVSLMNTNQRRKGADLLALLVKNNADFEGIERAVEVLTGFYQENEDYLSIVNAMILLPDDRRSPGFYRTLSQAYKQLGNLRKAKESLMYITDKDKDVLRSLAYLQYLTDDLVMAEHSYRELDKIETDRIHKMTASVMIAHISYLKENWQDAVAYYDKVINDLANMAELGGLTVAQIAQETVISLYRVSNRPRAESVYKTYKNLLENDNKAQSLIELNEGIYQMSVNRSRADRSFRDIIRNEAYHQDIKLRAHFWRGVNNLENRQVDEAFKNFTESAKSEDINLRNESLLKLGTISFSKEQFQESLDFYFRVIRDDIAGNLALDAAKNFAIVCKTIGEWQKAINAYHIILDRGGEGKLEGETIFNIAYCHFRDRQYSEAIPMFERSITLLEDREMKAEAQYWIGESYSNLGQYDRAATEFLKVGYYYPDLVDFVATSEIKLSEAYIKQGRNDAAKAVLERIINRYGRNSDWGRQAANMLQQL